MNFFKVLFSDIRSIYSKKFTTVSVIAIIMVPLIYGGLYLAAFWDPYGKTENIPVAVVNLDKGGTTDNAIVNYGNDMVDKLKNNKDLAWKFVKTRKEAEAGLAGDKYYAMIIIPDNFSQNLLDADKGKLQKPKLIYVSNKKKNYVVGLVTDKAAKAVKESVDQGIMDNFTNKVFDNLYEVRDGMESAADGTSQIKDGVTELKDKIPTMEDGINNLYDGSSTINDKLHDAYDGSNKLHDGLNKLNNNMPDLLDGVNKLYKGSSSLNKKINDAYDGSTQLRDGVTSLNDKMPDLSNGVNQIYDGSSSVKESLGTINDSMPKLIDGVDKLRDGSNELKNGLNTAASSAQALYAKDDQGNVKQDVGLPALKNGADKMQSKIPESIMAKLLTPDYSGVKPPIDNICDGLDLIYEGMQKLDPAIKSGTVPISQTSINNWKNDFNIVGNLDSYFNEIKNSNDAATRNSDLLKIADILNGSSIDAPSSKLAQTAVDLNVMANEIEKSDYYKQAMSLIQSTGNANTLPDQLKQLILVHNTLKQLSAGASNIDNSLGELKQTLALYQGATSIASGLGDASNGVGNLVGGLQQLAEGSTNLYNGLDKLHDSVKVLQNGTELLYDNSQNLRDGVNKFKGTVPDLTSGISTLSDGTRDLSDGLFKINEGSKTITDKLGELNQKVPDIQNGVQQLNDGSTDLSDGLFKLLDGSSKLKDGIKTLKDKMPDLKDGVGELYEGIAELNDKMKEGAEKLSDKLVVSSKNMGKYISDPVNFQDKPLYNVKTYGEGMAPYFVSLSLWVGALMMFFVITEKVDYNLKAKVSPASIVLGKYLTYSVIGIFQAILISIIVLKIGLKPSNIHAYFAFNIFLSLVFVAILQNFVFLFGDAGRLLAVIVLLLQLTSSNGTFPGELLPKFFRTIGPYLPFTYSISAMREINSGIDARVLTKDIDILIVVMIAFLILSMVSKRHIDNIKTKFKNKNLKIKAKGIEEKEQNNHEHSIS
ncbi:YhgE/Pip domain-containing protein [Clostridium sp. DJ247]|uniref:YhgE/Pip domain-containing protein n=1 Tax=Clostridium sp. DJ247 TaxID=2726188 RepID=UPI0016250D62|nr:YhgE/Pip domain-containing protein [Clostridium sp. DJ247]MBC2580180.1 YhgE/Pip domain-containing protein [Clostridium sp. DJ247]